MTEVPGAFARPPVVSAEEWQTQRDELLRAEKEATRTLDALAAKRRQLPMVRFDNNYVFDTSEGRGRWLTCSTVASNSSCTSSWTTGDAFCPGCTHFTNNVSDLTSLHGRGVTFVTVSNMPLDQIQEYKARMGWKVPFVSSRGNGFAAGTGAGDLFRLTVFLRDGDDVYLTYSTTARGVDRLLFSNNILDLTPYGRQEDWEDSPPGWPQHPTYG